jgi:hypothetical protein
MMYFWLIPAVVLLALVIWLLYSNATKRAPGRSEGRTVVDKGPEDQNEH